MLSNQTIHNGLFWFLSVTTLMSGLLGFLLKIDSFYNPDAYLVYNSKGLLLPGDGTTPFESCAHFVIGVAYVGPLFGMWYAKLEGSVAAKQVAAIFPFLYHAAMIPGVVIVFSEALNPNKAPLVAAVSMHVVYAGLFYIFFQTAGTNGKEKGS